MSEFVLHTPETASEQGRDALERVRKAFGFTPNLLKVLADAPAAAHGYLDLGGRVAESSFSPTEQQIVLLTTSFENGCDYCMAAHSMIAQMVGVDDADLAALREGRELPDVRLNALREFARSVVRERGRVPAQTLRAFLDQGFTRANVLEVILGVAMKTLSNYANHMAETPLDAAMEPFRWAPPAGLAAG